MKRRLIQYGGALLFGGAVAILVFWLRGLFSGPDRETCMKILSDGFLAAGLLLLASGALVRLSDAGAFDGLNYAFRNLFVAMHGAAYREEHKLGYEEYKEKKHAKKKGVLFLFAGGGLYFALAILFTVLFFV